MENKIYVDNKRQIVLTFRNDKNSWQDSTKDIKSIYKAFKYGKFTGYDVYFQSGKYFYSKNKLFIYNVLKTIDIFEKNVYVNDDLIHPNTVLLLDNDRYLIKTKNDVYVVKNIKITENKQIDKYNYFKRLGSHAENNTQTDDPLNMLGRKYRDFVVNDYSALKYYFKGEYKKSNDDEIIITPFDSNQSQMNAIKEALSNNISVIEGPPGTGKTQTILNMIANIIIRKKNVAIISNNNAAIENIYDKLKEKQFEYIAAKLGKLDNVNDFFENVDNSAIENVAREEYPLDRDEKFKIKRLYKQTQQVYKTEIKIAEITKEIEHLKIEMSKYEKTVKKRIIFNKKFDSNTYSQLINMFETPKRIGFFRRLYLKFIYKINLKNEDLLTIIQNLEVEFYNSRLHELKNILNSEIEKMALLQKSNPIGELKTKSATFFKKAISNHYKSQKLKEFNSQNYKSNYKLFIQRFPVILSTSQSILNNAPEGFLFDYLIIDEASQSDLLSSVLALNVAAKVIVVGDSKQLQQIENENLFDDSKRLAKNLNIEKSYRYEDNSILKSIKSAIKNVPTTLLREHYRSAPDIIEFCNQMFYDGELIALTKNDGVHINIIKTVPGNHARKNPYGSGMYNQREIDEIKILMKNKELNNVGIISPFRYQANLIAQNFNDTGLEADTVHKFQGRQKDEIILSFVVNNLEKNDDNIENRLYDFINNNALLNVAISRAKTHVTAIVSDKVYHSEKNIIKDFIKYAEYLYGNDATAESKVTSVFDYLYRINKESRLIKIKKNEKMHMSELLMYEMIEKILKYYPKIGFTMHTRLSNLINNVDQISEDEVNYVMHPWTHVDFMFFHKVTKETLFVLEVDGIAYHEQNIKQLNKDEIKDRVLLQNKIPCYRFKTNESNEEYKLIKILSKFNY